MKVLVADKFEQSGIDGLKAAGCEVVYQPDLKEEALADAIRATAPDVLVVRGTAVRASMLGAGTLALVVRAGAGYNSIDVAAASKRGIYVSNCPGKNAIAVAELAFALLAAIDRRVPDNVADLRAGTWNKKEYSKARGLFGRTLGLLGYGNIGQEMAKRAHAFGMPIVVWSRRLAAGGTAGRDQAIPMRILSSPEAVAASSDILSVHLALTPETRGLVNASVLNGLKPGSYFINTARAEIVDDAALEQVAREGRIRVGLDVFAAEPATATGQFDGSDRVAAQRVRHASHRRLDRPGAGSRSRPKRCASSRPTRTPARCPTSSTWRRRRRPRTCWSCGTAIGPACWRTCSSICAPATSTCRRWIM